MLVLYRHVHQDIVIGDDITIRVLEIRKDTVRLGIVAPRVIPVNRREVYERLKKDELDSLTREEKDHGQKETK